MQLRLKGEIASLRDLRKAAEQTAHSWKGDVRERAKTDALRRTRSIVAQLRLKAVGSHPEIEMRRYTGEKAKTGRD